MGQPHTIPCALAAKRAGRYGYFLLAPIAIYISFHITMSSTRRTNFSPPSRIQLPFIRFPSPFRAKRPQGGLRPGRKRKSAVSSKASYLDLIDCQTECEQLSILL